MAAPSEPPSNADPRRSRVRARWGVLVVLLGTAVLAIYALGEVLARCGHPAVPLDDAFIHFQYARRIAEGHGLSYVDGEGFSSGATSLLWPAALAAFHALGFRDLAIIWPAWGLGFAALAALTIETYRIAEPLTGRGEASGAAAMVLAFGGHVWCAASGMEVVPLAWALAYAARLAAEWREAPPEHRSRARRHQLWLVAVVGPLIRPEGALASLLVAVALLGYPARDGGADVQCASRRQAALRTGAAALPALIGPLLVPLLNWITTGQPTSSTTVVKWLPGNPYYGHGEALRSAIGQNVRLLFETLLDGREWSALVVPEGARPFAIAALVAIPAVGVMRARSFRAACVLAIALGMLIPCTYYTFLWNRLRYLWPFAFAWFVGIACAARCVSELLAALTQRLAVVGTLLSWASAAALGSHLPWSTADLAQSASAIDRQQVALGRWAAQALPPSALIGVNDTGAIAYLGGHRTFDVVGLTTPGEARYWVAGAGSRFEHYERLQRSAPERLPTHFIVYPNWLACEPVLGDELHSATVLDQSILGGATMTAFTARRDQLGSGDRPRRAPADGSLEPLDELDVADLESEVQHHYDVGATRETDDVTLAFEEADRDIADGARLERTFDRFELAGGPAARLVARLTAAAPVTVELRIDGAAVGQAHVEAGGWTEVSWAIAASAARRQVTLAALAAPALGVFGSAHYWLFPR